MKYNGQIKQKKNNYKFNLDRQRSVEISSDFDNGNISLIKQVTQLQYRLQCVQDNTSSNNKKNWFHFKVTASNNIKLRLYIEGCSVYQPMYQEHNWGKPVYKIGSSGRWNTFNDAFLVLRDEVNLVIDVTFDTQQPIYFALSIPFTYKDMQDYISSLQYIIPQSLCLSDQIIITTEQSHNVHMLTFQDKQVMQQKQLSKSSRCIILITSRVHPGQVSSTYCLKGMIDFIIRACCLQSQILRKMFTFVVFPMVNPDGVQAGHYRMDLNGQNLNRVYLEPNSTKQQFVLLLSQSVYAMKTKINQLLLKGDKIMFHFDLHSHSTLKRSFIYGNAFDDIISQTQTQVYCRLLDKNCRYFQQSICQFGQKHMKFKDKGQLMTKEGCARVVISKLANVTYSYTIQSSLFPIQPKTIHQNQKVKPITNLGFQINGFYYDSFQDKDMQYSQQPNIIDQNRNLGIKTMLSIVDLMLKNPYSSLDQNSLDQMRKQIATRNLQNQQRFKMLDTKAYHKSKFISQFTKNQFNSKYKNEWTWLSAHHIYSKVQWPTNFSWFKINSLYNGNNGKLKLKTQGKQAKSFIKSESYVTKLKTSQTLSNLIDQAQRQQSIQNNQQRLPLIRKSMQPKSKRIIDLNEVTKTLKDKLQQSNKKKNVLSTNRSNILLTFIQDDQQKQQKKQRQRRIISLKMALYQRYPNKRFAKRQNSIENITQTFENQSTGLKASYSQSQLPSNSKNNSIRLDQGIQFQDKILLKSLEVRRSRKQLINNKITMLKRANQTKKVANQTNKVVNKNSLMKFPDIGKAFLVTNVKSKLQKQICLKTNPNQVENQQSSCIEFIKFKQKKIYTEQFIQ